MTLLLDTHVFVWWLRGDARLRPRVRTIIEENDGITFVSAVSGYEMSQKYRLGKWPEVAPFMEGFERLAATANIEILTITALHAVRAGLLPGTHRDPFDRMLAAQATIEGLRIVSGDEGLRNLGVKPIWD
ncbi:type II toxin-antitoxin system VapC family toxin [Aurantimonas sp. HBX-1]|uniref:type II toxin-antitoxin system VapC family toxin n=1 Tax=Aurantimonas sp. HBX-1 TaxID=2906072 RepID=UPI001F1E43C3|nr:type II toxin-antitoxin system VapC family toxin [Aurantimonas sp. HBX-1]UIJ73723.1 type II toxin-antitoxin system VapC family toxin [Aurantimonas sp. HBX-1]